MAAQSIRRSQFITIYGPGAILEGPDGPRVITTLDGSGLFVNRRPEDYEITDMRLSQALLEGAGILRLPSNAELGEPDAKYVYDTRPFPSWALCTDHGRLYHKTASDSRACPACPPLSSPPDAWKRVRRQAIRFIRACPDGHMDDVDWAGIIPHSQPGCRPSWLNWVGGGGALRDVNVQCPQCGESINLGIIYSRDWLCSGKRPEHGNARPGGCNQRSKIIQRGAANLRMPEIQTALTIPPRASALHRLMELASVRAVLVTQPISVKADLLDKLGLLVAQGLLRRATITEIDRHSESDIRQAIADVVSGNIPLTVNGLRLQEFQALQHAAANGAPPQPASRTTDPPQFEVVLSHVRTVIGPGNHTLRITPVNRLRVVMVQTGYRRIDPLNSLVDCAYDSGQRTWYPGVELFGEGVFIDFSPPQGEQDNRHFPLTGRPNVAWGDAWLTAAGDPTGGLLRDRDALHPVFVWWHTLSHRLINTLSVDSGYSSAAIRERVYLEVNAQGQARGGVLLYTAQPGGDGTLGGLVALVPDFERVIKGALLTIDACSNDPLCGEEEFSAGKYNGAGCYACTLVSETSCEYRNMGLDRSLLRDNLP